MQANVNKGSFNGQLIANQQKNMRTASSFKHGKLSTFLVREPQSTTSFIALLLRFLLLPIKTPSLFSFFSFSPSISLSSISYITSLPLIFIIRLFHEKFESYHKFTSFTMSYRLGTDIFVTNHNSTSIVLFNRSRIWNFAIFFLSFVFLLLQVIG